MDELWKTEEFDDVKLNFYSSGNTVLVEAVLSVPVPVPQRSLELSLTAKAPPTSWDFRARSRVLVSSKSREFKSFSDRAAKQALSELTRSLAIQLTVMTMRDAGMTPKEIKEYLGNKNTGRQRTRRVRYAADSNA